MYTTHKSDQRAVCISRERKERRGYSQDDGKTSESELVEGAMN